MNDDEHTQPGERDAQGDEVAATDAVEEPLDEESSAEGGGEPGLLARFPALKRLGQIWKRRVPVVRQTQLADCGAACLSMIVGFFGGSAKLDEVRELMGVRGDGTSALAIVKGARYLGLRATGYSISSADDLEALQLPAVLHWEFNHFVVLERVTDEGVQLVDPAFGRRFVTTAQFDKSFTGIAISFEESDAFQRNLSSGRRLYRFVERSISRNGVLAPILVASVLLQLFALALPLLTGVVVDRVVPKQDLTLLQVMSVGLLALVVFNFLGTLVRGQLLVHFRTHLDSAMVFGFLEHLVELPYAFFQLRSAGDLFNRLASNQVIRDILSTNVVSAILDGVMVVAYLVLLMFLDPKLGAVTLALGGAQVLVQLFARNRQRDLTGRSLEAAVRSQSYVVQLLSGMETLKASGTELRALGRWSNLYVDELNVSIEKGRYSAWTEAIFGALRTMSPLVLLVYGAYLSMNGRFTVGEMMALIALANGFLVPLSTLVSSFGQLQLLGTYLERINDVMETAPEQDRRTVAAPARLRGNIEVQQVSFRHGPMAPMVVRELSFSVRAGQTVALVGPSGSGKSTLARLLVGLYKPTSGRILYDQIDLQTQETRLLRGQLGIVMQSPYLFGQTVREAIALGHPDANLDRVVQAAKLAHIHDDIIAMPMGYETMLGDGGNTLSGGQRQRMALARALLHRPAILLLDEATSSLDTEMEAKVQESIDALGATRIIIAHRLSTIIRADQSLVLDDGQIVERGRHHELVASGGRYAQLVSVQDEGSRR